MSKADAPAAVLLAFAERGRIHCFPGGDVALRPVPTKESAVGEGHRLHTTSPRHGWECEQSVPVRYCVVLVDLGQRRGVTAALRT
jgi:hypothetical protein